MPIKLQAPIAPPLPTVLEQAAALQLDDSPEEQTGPEYINPLLPKDSKYISGSRSELPYGLSEKLAEIEQILGDSGRIPVSTLRLACKSVMLCLKQNEDSILQLEPEDQQLIVQGYLRAADVETQAILIPKEKAEKKRTARAKAKELQAEIAANPNAEDEF